MFHLTHQRLLLASLLCLSLAALPVAAQVGRPNEPPGGREISPGPQPPVLPQPLPSNLCKGGDDDNYAPPPDTAVKNPAIFASCPMSSTSFDQLIENGKCFGHLYENCWPRDCRVEKIILHARWKAGRAIAGNDSVSIVDPINGATLWTANIASLGSSPVSVTIPFSPPLTSGELAIRIQDDQIIDYANLEVFYDCRARVCGRKFFDRDCDGKPDAGEAVLPNWTIVASGPGGTSTTVTDANGNYCLNLAPGSYTIGELAQTGWVQTAPGAPGVHQVTLAAGQAVDGYDFGNRPCESCQPPASICGVKYLDRSCDGIRGPGDTPLAGWTITSTSAGTTISTVTDAAGHYCFTNLKPGTYVLGEQSKPGWLQTGPKPNGTHTIVLGIGQSRNDVDFGNQLCGKCKDGPPHEPATEVDVEIRNPN